MASALAKIILFGEHAVVHGQPAIAVPVKALRAQVKVDKAPPGSGISIIVPAIRQRLHLNDSADNTLIYTARLVLDKLNIHTPPDLILTLDSTVPIGSGLGSGAAVSTAIARTLLHTLGQSLSLEELNALIYEVEKAHHGTPSGIDNTVIVYEQPVYFVRDQPIEKLKIAQPFTLIIGDSGQSTPTYITVGDVRKLYEKDHERTLPIFNRIGEITRAARAAIENGTPDLLGEMMNENHTLLQKLTVSSVALDVLCDAAMQGGALGAKMSGGGRGGNMLALVKNEVAEKVIHLLRSAGAVRVIKTQVS